MYDEPWLIAHQLKNVIRMTSGNRLLFDFAFFNVGSNLTPTGEVDVGNEQLLLFSEEADAQLVSLVNKYAKHRVRPSPTAATTATTATTS